MIILDCQGCIEREKRIKHLEACLSASRNFEHAKIREIVDVDSFIATRLEGHDGNWGHLVDRVKLLISHIEQTMRENIKRVIG